MYRKIGFRLSISAIASFHLPNLDTNRTSPTGDRNVFQQADKLADRRPIASCSVRIGSSILHMPSDFLTSSVFKRKKEEIDLGKIVCLLTSSR